MRSINHDILTHYQNDFSEGSIKSLGLKFPAHSTWEHGYASIGRARISPGFPVTNFQDLVKLTAEISIRNNGYDIFYRGQINDYIDRNKRTTVYPSICRPHRGDDGKQKASVRRKTIEGRFDQLRQFIKYAFREESASFEEHHYSLIQHYEIMPTPLIDITQSLRVAASFALRKSTAGFLYMFGLPYPNGSISHFIDLNITLVKLQNVCTPEALRPRYQEGFLVGRLPFNPYKAAGDNLARRLICKFKLDNTAGGFWKYPFTSIPDDLLFPDEDPYKKALQDKFMDFSLKNP